MYSLIAASAFFLLIHFGVSGTRLRDVLVARIGAGPYRGAFALASLVGLVWMSSTYGRAPTVDLWGQLTGLRPLAFVHLMVNGDVASLIFFGSLLLLASANRRSPTHG
ncbi:MAG TPA: NnrU family protein, partial [Steroidobacteraceae bacterium]|nr:NnrU family protein [Steroidobacteraceae bacterium]